MFYLDVILGLIGQDVSRELVVVDVSLNSRVFLPWKRKAELKDQFYIFSPPDLLPCVSPMTCPVK